MSESLTKRVTRLEAAMAELAESQVRLDNAMAHLAEVQAQDQTEARERGRILDERIAALVSGISELVSRMDRRERGGE